MRVNISSEKKKESTHLLHGGYNLHLKCLVRTVPPSPFATALMFCAFWEGLRSLDFLWVASTNTEVSLRGL